MPVEHHCGDGDVFPFVKHTRVVCCPLGLAVLVQCDDLKLAVFALCGSGAAARGVLRSGLPALQGRMCTSTAQLARCEHISTGRAFLCVTKLLKI